ncbi:MAG: restriction endonuclease subunit S [Lachnospiraceae bacterium]|nr:restriction endonuclease subunit S [Lachnospiraceae bacterium]
MTFLISSFLWFFYSYIFITNPVNDNLEDLAWTIYKDFISEIPNDQTESIYNVLNIVNGAPFASDLFNTEGVGYPLVRIRDLSKCDPDVFTNEKLSRMEYVNPGDILIGMDGEFVPHIWFGHVGVLNQRVCKVTPVEKFIHPMFLYLTLKPILSEIQRTQGGTTVIHIGKKDFDKMECICLLPEQHSVLGKKFSPIYDLYIANAQETFALSEMLDVLLSKLSR